MGSFFMVCEGWSGSAAMRWLWETGADSLRWLSRNISSSRCCWGSLSRDGKCAERASKAVRKLLSVCWAVLKDVLCYCYCWKRRMELSERSGGRPSDSKNWAGCSASGRPVREWKEIWDMVVFMGCVRGRFRPGEFIF